MAYLIRRTLCFAWLWKVMYISGDSSQSAISSKCVDVCHEDNACREFANFLFDHRSLFERFPPDFHDVPGNVSVNCTDEIPTVQTSSTDGLIEASLSTLNFVVTRTVSLGLATTTANWPSESVPSTHCATTESTPCFNTAFTQSTVTATPVVTPSGTDAYYTGEATTADATTAVATTPNSEMLGGDANSAVIWAVCSCIVVCCLVSIIVVVYFKKIKGTKFFRVGPDRALANQNNNFLHNFHIRGHKYIQKGGHKHENNYALSSVLSDSQGLTPVEGGYGGYENADIINEKDVPNGKTPPPSPGKEKSKVRNSTSRPLETAVPSVSAGVMDNPYQNTIQTAEAHPAEHLTQSESPPFHAEPPLFHGFNNNNGSIDNEDGYHNTQNSPQHQKKSQKEKKKKKSIKSVKKARPLPPPPTNDDLG